MARRVFRIAAGYKDCNGNRLYGELCPVARKRHRKPAMGMFLTGKRKNNRPKKRKTRGLPGLYYIGKVFNQCMT